MKRLIPIVMLICALLTGAVSAAFSSPDFDGGMISGICLEGDTLYAADLQHKVIWRVEDGEDTGTMFRGKAVVGFQYGRNGRACCKRRDGKIVVGCVHSAWHTCALRK